MFNEASSIGSVVADLRHHFPRVVCVDDGSSDGCDQVAAAAGATVVRHPVNLGQGAALQTGFDFALEDRTWRHVVTFDADGQHRPTDAVAMLEVARTTGCQVVLGSRFLTKAANVADIPRGRRLVLRAATLFTRASTGLELSDTHNGLRVLSRRAVEVMDLSLNGMAHASQLLSQVAANRLSYVEAPVSIAYTEYSRTRGQSNANALNIAFDLAVERLRGTG
jgi:polyprenyl-phospho-N-acetylgalactosaminyl synthase